MVYDKCEQNEEQNYYGCITAMDEQMGRLRKKLRELGIADNTMLWFCSDNGPEGGIQSSSRPGSAGPYRGRKRSLYEGGVRVPLIARWPGRIKPGISQHISAFWDVLPTLAELGGFAPAGDIDGISFAPTLLGQPGRQKQHEYLYWEYHGSQALRAGEWKAVRRKGQEALELYTLKNDIGEQHDVASAHPEVTARLAELMKRARTESEHFPMRP